MFTSSNVVFVVSHWQAVDAEYDVHLTVYSVMSRPMLFETTA